MRKLTSLWQLKKNEILENVILIPLNVNIYKIPRYFQQYEKLRQIFSLSNFPT